MRTRALRLWLCLLVLPGCGPTPSSTDAGGGSTDAGPGGTCYLVSGLMVEGPRIPGEDLVVTAVDAGSGRTYDVAWTAAEGTLDVATGPSVVWTLSTDLALDQWETTTLEAVVSAPGCPDVTFEAGVAVDWPPELRTIVLYDPAVTGSFEVAQYYADFRSIPAGALCPVSSSDQTTLAGADFPAWLATVMACADALGEQIHYIVPVWGVPYKVSDRVNDFASGTPVTISLDALLAYGDTALTTTDSPFNPLYQNGNSVTGVYDPWIPFGQFKAAYPSDYFLVARIDGADAAAAMALVDRTAAAQLLADTGALAGTVYVDGRFGEPHPATDVFGSYEAGDWNMAGVQATFEALGTYPVVADWNPEEFGTAPALLLCPDALYYAGWYSFGNYNDVFTWNVGAIGAHLDSCSACDIRAGGDWAALALQRGITATFGAVNEPYVAGMPEYDQFFAYLTSGASFGEAAYESTIVGAWMMVWVGDPLYRPYAM